MTVANRPADPTLTSEPSRCRYLDHPMLWIACVAMTLTACDEDVASDTPPQYLIVQRAQSQPSEQSDAALDYGLLMVIQASGGDRLRVRTLGATHRLTTTDPLTDFSCLDVPASPLFVQVLPVEEESLVFVDLLAATGEPTDAGSFEARCPGRVLESRIIPTSLRAPTDLDAGQHTDNDGGRL